MVVQRKNIEKTYDGICDIIEFKKVKKDNGSYTNVEVITYKDIPCKLSATFRPSSKSIKSSVNDGDKNKISQTVKIFLAPEVIVKPSSKIKVHQHNITREYWRSGEPIIYNSHQEIALDLIESFS